MTRWHFDLIELFDLLPFFHIINHHTYNRRTESYIQPYISNRQPIERRTHIQDYPKTYITRTQSAWYFCMLNARHDWLSIPIRKGTTTMVSASKGTNNKRETNFLVYHTLVKAWRIRLVNYPLVVNLGLQDLLSKLYFCGYKIRCAPSKVTCRLLPQRSDKSLFRFAKENVLKENELFIRILVADNVITIDKR